MSKNFEMIDPNKLVYLVRSMSGEAPAVDSSVSLSEQALVMHEEDWRQIELVSRGLAAEVNACIQRIREVRQEELREGSLVRMTAVDVVRMDKGGGIGFRNPHVRREVPEPLKGTSLPFNDLRAAFPDADCHAGVSLLGSPHPILGGFVLRTRTLFNLYGRKDGCRVSALCLEPAQREAPSEAEWHGLAGLARAHDLVLVNWLAAQVFEPDVFVRYFMSMSKRQA